MNARSKPEGLAPKPGSVAHRVLEFLARNPDEELYVSDIAQKFDVERTSVQAGLVGAEQAGAVVVTKDETGKRVYRLGSYASQPAPVLSAPSGFPTVEDIQAVPVLRIPFPDRRRQREEAVGALRTKLMEMAVEQCIPVTAPLKPLLREALKQIDGRTFKTKAIAQGEFCWRVA